MAEETGTERIPLFKVFFELFIALLVDVTVKAYLHALIPLLPYGWMLVFAHSTWKLLTSSRVQKAVGPHYTYWRGRNIVASYVVVFCLGGGIFVATWYALGKVLGKPSITLEGSKAEDSTTSAPPNEKEKGKGNTKELPDSTKKVPPLQPPPTSLKSESLRLSKELLEFVNLRLPNKPVLRVPSVKDPEEQAALSREKQEFHQRAMDQFNRDFRAYYSEHFADRVTKITSELTAKGVFLDDQNNDCRGPLFLEVYAICAKQIRDAASKLP